MARANGLILWENDTIVAIATNVHDPSSNEKTGPLVQTWILVKGTAPHLAMRTGEDAAVCGDCKYRPANGGGCYVVTHNAPLSVWKGYQRGIYPRFDPLVHAEDLRGKSIRLGSYGDPAMVPVHVWDTLRKLTVRATGYTHQWRRVASGYKRFLMASVDSPAELAEARAAGWRTFRVRVEGAPLLRGEVVCPASEEGGYSRTCETCMACSGGDVRKASVTIEVHGSSNTLPKARRHLTMVAA